MKLRLLLILAAVSALPAHAADLPEWVDHFRYRVKAETSMMECLSCHNGTKAAAVSDCSKGMCKVYANHLVGVIYPPVGKESQFADVSNLLEKGMLLEAGRITCVSCHDLYEKKKYQLRVYPERSALCMTCHRK